MNIVIESLSRDALDRITRTYMYTCRWFKSVVESEAYGCVDVTLGENVVVKARDNKITLDLGGELESIKDYEFFRVVIE